MAQEPADSSITTLSFKIDSGLIDRLGKELVGRAETAVSELIKNAYDADARKVRVEFLQSNRPGGTLRIEDDGVGMTIGTLSSGFMTISSTDKIHNPKSDRFLRNKAGRKGIGRFATQRLGKKLTITTQTLESNTAMELTIDWDAYRIDTDLTSVENSVRFFGKEKPEGTTLLIEGLREQWSEADMKRVYRYVSDLLQPNFLSERSRSLNLANQLDDTFAVEFIQILDGISKIIADPERMIFSKALATIEGYIDNAHDGYCAIQSTSLNLPSDIIRIEHNKVYNEDIESIRSAGGIVNEAELKDVKYRRLNEVHFKVYYFIYNREEYYSQISKGELLSIQRLASEQGGIRLYRNGFRVLPYGEPNDDWLKTDRRYSGLSGATNIPFANKNLFGFVEIIDQGGQMFQETASREGLIENEAFAELVDFLHKALIAASGRIRYGVEIIKNRLHPPNVELSTNPAEEAPKSTIEKLEDLERNVNKIIDSSSDVSDVQNLRDDTKKIVQQIRTELLLLIDELGMLRVLAGLGLTIGEFTHEVIQFSPSIMGDLSVLTNQNLNESGLNSLENLKRTIQLFISYTSYFNATVSANISRELKPQDVEKIVRHFGSIVIGDLNKMGIEFSFEPYGFDLITIPMHASEWSSILFNLYTNAKKAIKRKGVPGRIKIIVGKDKTVVYLEFHDNGDGIPDENRRRVFEPFFTTSSPLGFDSTDDEKLTGTGLGLKIVKDVIQTYGGTIEIVKPDLGYSTCMRIELPLATQKQKDEYGL